MEESSDKESEDADTDDMLAESMWLGCCLLSGQINWKVLARGTAVSEWGGRVAADVS